MNHVIVVAGKGGTGKTTVAAFLTLVLAGRRDGSVLSIDADPNSNLAEALGLKAGVSIADIIDDVARHPESVPSGMGKDHFVEYRVHEEITEAGGFDLLVMGRPEGPGCYCYINNVLRNCMEKIVGDYAYVVIDNEAGLEHFSRKTMRACSDLLVISDTSKAGLRSASRIFALVEALGILAERKFLVVNKETGDGLIDKTESTFDVEKVLTVPYDERVLASSARGDSLLQVQKESSTWTAVKEIVESLWPKN